MANPFSTNPEGSDGNQSSPSSYGQSGQPGQYGQSGQPATYGAARNGADANPAYEPQGEPGLYNPPSYGQPEGANAAAYGQSGQPAPNEPYGQDAYGQPDYGRNNPYAPSQPAYGQPDSAQPVYGAVGQPDYTRTGYAGQPYDQPYAGQPYANPGQPYGGYGYYPYQQELGWNAMAIAGFVSSFFVAIVGLVLSIIGLNQIKRTGEKGRGLAIAGIIISAVQMALVVVLIVFFVAVIGSGASQYEDRYDDHVYNDAGDYGYYQDAEETAAVAGTASGSARLDAVIADTYAALR